jgi:rod shape determining protein RodA
MATAALLAAGLITLYSIDHGHGTAHFRNQLINAGIGAAVFFACYKTRTQWWRVLVWWIYGASVAMLAAVPVIGVEINNAVRWLEVGPIQFQPSEIAKIGLILVLADFFARRWQRRHEFSTFAISAAIAAVPAGLHALQPHLGGAVGMMVIWFAVTLVAGVSWRILLGTVGAFLALAVGLYVSGALPSHAYDRIEAMTSEDPQGSNWQKERALIAVGNGGVLGTGYLNGDQKAAGYVPEVENDFAFTVVAEEGGLVGSLLLLGAFAFFLSRVWFVSYRSSKPFGQLFAAGVLGLLGFHIVVNLGMVLGLTPVVGLWLPFISQGGTALWLCLAMVGILTGLSHDESSKFFDETRPREANRAKRDHLKLYSPQQPSHGREK